MEANKAMPATEPQIHLRPDLPTLFTDRMQLTKRTDGNLIMSWQQLLPPGLFVEQSRIMVSAEHMRAVIDVLCQNTGYFPEKPVEPSPKG